MVRGLGALRNRAEQGISGNRSFTSRWEKGGVAMEKHVFFRSQSVALTVVGWVAFICGVLIEASAVKLVFLAVARVLPRALQPRQQ